MSNTQYLIGGKLYETFTSPQYVATVPAGEVKELSRPFIVWTGHKMPVSMVHSCLAFFRDCYQRYQGEAMVRFAYHPEQGWKVVPMPQEGRAGMAVKDTADETILQQLSKDGYSLFGSAHSHCQAAAFASGTDDHDESGSPGLHFTLGKIDSTPVDLHVRATLRKVKFEVKLSDWFSDPRMEGLVKAGLPTPVLDDCLRYFLLNPEKDITFPSEWKEAILEVRKWTATGWDSRSTWGAYKETSSLPPLDTAKTSDYRNSVSSSKDSTISDLLSDYLQQEGFSLTRGDEVKVIEAVEDFLWNPAFHLPGYIPGDSRFCDGSEFDSVLSFLLHDSRCSNSTEPEFSKGCYKALTDFEDAALSIIQNPKDLPSVVNALTATLCTYRTTWITK